MNPLLRLPIFAATIALVAVAGCKRRSEPVVAAADSSPQTQASSSQAKKAGWLTNYEQAQEQAKTGHKLMLLDFTGSDWCGWCIKLDREVFSNPKFKEYASQNLVLLEVDFPRDKEIPAALQAQNERLAMKFQIQGFPTIVVLNSEGKQVGELGYVPGGPEAFIAELEKMRKG